MEARLHGEMRVGQAEVLVRMDQPYTRLEAKFDAKFDKFDDTLGGVNARLTPIEAQNRSTRANVWSVAVRGAGCA